MSDNRRDFLRHTGIGLVAVYLGGTTQYLTPAAAHAAGNYDFLILSEPEQKILAAVAEALQPGCVRAGLCEFIDYQLSRPPAENLLMLRYLGVSTPYADFYSAGLANIDTLAKRQHGESFVVLQLPQQTQLISSISTRQPGDWQGPPAPLFYFALRSDAVDVFYGTEAGFERLGVPYMAHIAPPEPW
jgi:hypothetical protein